MGTLTLDYPMTIAHTTNTKQTEDVTDTFLMQAICYHKAEWAVEKLYERYKRYVYSLAYSMLSDAFLAEDIVQDVFLTLWHKAHAYHEQQGSMKSWLQAITRNRTIDKLRSVAHRDYQCIHLQSEDSPDPLSPEPEMWEQVWECEQSTYIRKALLQLPPEQREAIELSYFQGLTHAEIASQLQLPLGTVKGRMRLGLRKIKSLLQEYGMER